jgi:sugar/nucleoside kinase (ribokinase family)
VVALASAPMAAGSDTRSHVRVGGGGAAANTAAWLAATGHPVAYVGRAGDDPLGRAALAELAADGVDVRVRLDPERPTGTCVVVVTPDGQRSMFPDPGANAGLCEADLPADLIGPDRTPGPAHLHLSGYSLLTEGSRQAARAALLLALGSGLTVSVDAASAAPLRAVGPARVLDWLDGVHLLLAADEEASLLAGTQDPMEAGAMLARRFGQAVVKLGPRGAAWFGPPDATGATSAHVPAAAVEVKDTTGAGDCFAAGFLPPWLDGRPAEQALAAGCALAARVVARAGARPHR